MSSKVLFAFLAVFVGCSPLVKDTFNSQELSSSRGEKIYINSLNWGMTDDYQMSVVTHDSKKLTDRSDSVDAVGGLEPFFYSFNNDTLKLFFDGRVTYTSTEEFKTIVVRYIPVDRQEFQTIREKAYKNDGYHSVPMRRDPDYPPDMPKPPSR